MENLQNLICPICSSDIILKNKKFFCKNSQCKMSLSNFKLINNKLIMVDFDKSVLSEKRFKMSEGKSNVVRTRKGNSIKKIIFKILNGSSVRTEKNLNYLSSKLKNRDSLNILIVGGGTIGSGMNNFIKQHSNNITSFDVYESEYVDLIADAHSIPFKDSIFDLVIIQAVLEHVMYPNKVADECYRVTNSNGYIYAETPFLQHVHEGAYDFTRFTLMGKKVLFEKFYEINSGYIGGLGRTLLWSIEYTFAGIFRSRLIGKIFKIIFFWIRFLDFIIPNKWNLDGACGVYYTGLKKDNLIKKHPTEIIKEYQGAQ